MPWFRHGLVPRPAQPAASVVPRPARAAVVSGRDLGLVRTLADLDVLLGELDPDEPFPVSELGTPRGRQGSPRERVVLPEGWLDDADGRGCAVEEDLHSGG